MKKLINKYQNGGWFPIGYDNNIYRPTYGTMLPEVKITNMALPLELLEKEVKAAKEIDKPSNWDIIHGNNRAFDFYNQDVKLRDTLYNKGFGAKGLEDINWNKKIRRVSNNASSYSSLNDRIELNNSFSPSYYNAHLVPYDFTAPLIVHERTHEQQSKNNILGLPILGISKHDRDLLNAAYQIDKDPIYPFSSRMLYEKHATNRESRYNIWNDLSKQLGRNPTIEELNSYIETLPFDKLKEYMGGYSPDYNLSDEKALKKALIEVAQDSTSKNISNYAARGGKLDTPPERFFGIATPEVTDNTVYQPTYGTLLPEVKITAKGDPRKVNNDYYKAHSRARANAQEAVQEWDDRDRLVLNTMLGVGAAPVIAAHPLSFILGIAGGEGVNTGIRGVSKGRYKDFGEWSSNLITGDNSIAPLTSWLNPGYALAGASRPVVRGVETITRPYRLAKVVKEGLEEGIKNATKNGDIRVQEQYFNNPDKWYRVTETPEVYGIEQSGRNVTTKDIEPGTIHADDFRRTVGSNGLVAGTGENEGYWILKPKIFNMFKSGQAHGNTSQAAKGQIWQGTFAKSGKFPTVILEGEGNKPTFRGMTREGHDSRSHFILQNWEDIPQGARIGFHSGEMPLNNLKWFQRNSDGSYTLKGVVLPDKKLFQEKIRKTFEIPSINQIRLSKLTEGERLGIPKGERNQPYNPKQISEYVQGEDAVKMFKEYGGEPIPERSINGEQLKQYVNEVREKYGLLGNNNITDEEIIQALYKHSKELGGNTAAINSQGEPQLLFRGDTKRYTQLKPRLSPEELAEKSGTMDNSLGNLFLGELPGTSGKRTRGLERYLVTGREFRGNKVLEGSGTGSKAIMPDGTFASEWGNDIIEFPEGSYPLVTYNTKYGPNVYYKLPASFSESGVNDINAFVVRTPQMRDASKEISVLNDDFMVKGGPKVEYHGPIRREILDKDGFPLIVDENGNVVANGLAGSSDRQAMAQHYRYILNDAKAKKQGLLKSKGETDGEPGNYLRDEHDDYSYFALPNFNIRGIKHLLPYDLRLPRNWKDFDLRRKHGGKL